MKEKEELQHLNDRFVTYINRVRRLRDEKDRLNVTIEHMQTTTQEESGAVKRIFEKELQDARLLIDETAKEKARYQILATKNEDRVKDLETEWVLDSKYLHIFYCGFFGTLFSVAAVFAVFKKHGLMWVWLKEGFFLL